MKIKYLTLLTICLLNFFCSKNCILNYEIVETEYAIPLYSSQNEMFKKLEKTDQDRYELVNVNKSEIPYIMETLHSQIPETRNATENIINNLCNYSVQIAGVYDRKEKVKKIYLNFGCGFTDYESINAGKDYMIGIDGKETKFNHVYDGGDCFFEGVINTKTNKFSIIFINGEA